MEPYYLLLIDTGFIIQMSLALKHVTFLLNITFLLQKQNKKAVSSQNFTVHFADLVEILWDESPVGKWMV